MQVELVVGSKDPSKELNAQHCAKTVPLYLLLQSAVDSRWFELSAWTW